MTYVAVGDRAEDRADERGTPGEGSHARATRARAREGRIAGLWSSVTERVRVSRADRPSAVREDGTPDTVRGRSPWRDGPATPAAVLAYTRSGAWVPGDQADWLESLGKWWGRFALVLTLVVVTPLRLIQTPGRIVAGDVNPWRDGAASPREMFNRARAWRREDGVPASAHEWTDRTYGLVLFAFTAAVTYPLWILQRFSRFALVVVVSAILVSTFLGGAA